jgi:hypothetical protein
MRGEDERRCEMRELLKKRFELFVKMRWLKRISKETEKYKKLKEKTNRQLYVLNELLKEYQNIYDENLRDGRRA